MARAKERARVLGSLDTNVLLRYVLNDVPTQTRAVEELLSRGGKYAVSDAALIEMIFVLEKVYGLSRGVIADNLLYLVRHEQLVMNGGAFQRALPLYLKAPQLSFVDCILAAYAEEKRVTPLYTFDRTLGKKAGDSVRLLA